MIKANNIKMGKRIKKVPAFLRKLYEILNVRQIANNNNRMIQIKTQLHGTRYFSYNKKLS